MEEKEFVSLVNQLEDLARRNPGEYKFRVALLAALGYVFLIGVLVAVLLLVGFFVRRHPSYPNVGTARLVQKVVQHFPQAPCYVLGITSKRSWLRGQSNARDQKLIDELASMVTFPLEQRYRPLGKVFERIQGSGSTARRLCPCHRVPQMTRIMWRSRYKLNVP